MKKIMKIGKVLIGGDNPIAVQSMTNSKTYDTEATLEQIIELAEAGCDIVRLAVSNMAEVESAKSIIKQVEIPLVADIQFDYKLAIACSDIGFSKIRINPGNIGSEQNIKEVVIACKLNNTPIRIGVNSGSIEKEIYEKMGGSAEALAQSAIENVQMLEKYAFDNIAVSVKASDVATMIKANRLLDKMCEYPIHLGVTESGAYERGIYKSAIGIGALLVDGIGDTIRVSLTGDPVQEIYAAKKILQAIKKDNNYCEIVSCPTCSRCNIDLLSLVNAVTDMTKDIKIPLKIAVMGCIVNGPGEARDADIGVAGGDGKAVIFKKGEIVKTVKTEEILQCLKTLIDEIIL